MGPKGLPLSTSTTSLGAVLQGAQPWSEVPWDPGSCARAPEKHCFPLPFFGRPGWSRLTCKRLPWVAVCSGVTRPTTARCLHRKRPLGVAAIKGQDGGGACIGGKHCGDCVSAHIACSWALNAGGASGWLPLLSGAAANLALFGLGPLCQQTLNSGANAEMEEISAVPSLALSTGPSSPLAKRYSRPLLPKCPFWPVYNQVLCFLV